VNRLALLLLPLLAGCAVNEVGAGILANRCSDWYETGQVIKPHDDLTRTIRELLTRQGYDTPTFDASKDWVETDWDIHLSPRFREGYRTKLEVELLPLERGGYNIRSRSWFEVNNEDKNASNPDKAVWVGAAVSEKHRDRIPEAAMRFHSMLKLRLFGLNQ